VASYKIQTNLPLASLVELILMCKSLFYILSIYKTKEKSVY